jgi:hypothetical protein
MPTDLALAEQARPIQVSGRGGTGLPFSKGLMATSILAPGWILPATPERMERWELR